ncbi:hypothetical protein M5689_013205 [Euphorbia peplus]|nr:hypothetical protein M5689_013205 [Euphorbia peplus]
MVSRSGSAPNLSVAASSNGDTSFTLVTENTSSQVTPTTAPFINPFCAASQPPSISEQYSFSSWFGGAYPQPQQAPIFHHLEIPIPPQPSELRYSATPTPSGVPVRPRAQSLRPNFGPPLLHTPPTSFIATSLPSGSGNRL